MGKGMNPRPLTYIVNENGCHIINSHFLSVKGYARLSRDGERIQAHRYVYEQHHGKIPEGLVVRHKCDNPSCINPEHLEIGTQADNINDMVSRNRNAKGEKSGVSKFTEKQVEEILLETRYSNRKLAKMYNVGVEAILLIKQGKLWKHVYESVEDKIQKDVVFIVKGEYHGGSKLTEKEVEEILLNDTLSTKELSIKYNMSEATIYKIKVGDLWKDVYIKIKGNTQTKRSRRTLNKAEVKEILLNNSATNIELSKIYDVDVSCIYSIKKGKTWKSIYNEVKNNSNEENPRNTQPSQTRGNRKLSEEDVIFIIKNPDMKIDDLCLKFNISVNTVVSIRKGESWKYIHEKLKNT